MIVFSKGGGETKRPVSKKKVPPKFLGGKLPDVKKKDRRKVLAEWLTSPNQTNARRLINGSTIHQKNQKGDVIKKLIGSKLTIEEMINRLFIRGLCREPAPYSTAHPMGWPPFYRIL